MKSIEDIIVAHLHDEASTEEVKRLFEWIRIEPENAKEFARCSLLHAQLRGQFAGEERAESSAETFVERTVTSTKTQESRRIRNSGVLALVACLLVAVGASVWWMSAGRGARDDLIVLAPVEQGIANKPMVAFAFETEADLIAVAVMGRPQSRHEQQVIRMELVEVLKGDQQVGSLESADGVVSFGCIMPEKPKRFSVMYREGERVAVYLKNSGDGWSMLQMNHLTGEHEPQWKARIQPFLEVFLASKADDPEQRYAELLDLAMRQANQNGANGARNGLSSTSNGKTNSSTGLSDASYYGLLYNPDPRAAKFLRKRLVASVDSGLRPGSFKGHQGTQDPNGAETGSLNANALESQANGDVKVADGVRRQAAQQIVTLLAKMHDAHSIRLVMDYTALLSANERSGFIQALPELCRDADADTLRFVRGELNECVAALQKIPERSPERSALPSAEPSPESSADPSPVPSPVRPPDSRPADGDALDPSVKGSSGLQKGHRPGDIEPHDYYRTLIQTRQAIERLLENRLQVTPRNSKGE